LAFLLFPFFSRAQSATAQAAAIKTLVDSGNFIFHAQSATSMSGSIRQLETDYTVTVTKGKVTVDLPYFGQADAPPSDPTDLSIQSTFTVFDYTMTPGKKDGWNVLIKPKGDRTVQQITLNISSAGYIGAHVMARNKQPMNFTGVISSLN
jgi:hypothetical protein